MPGFFDNGPRGLIVGAAIVAVTWLPALRVPRAATGAITRLAGASLYVYLTHISLHPVLGRNFGPIIAALGSLAFGVATWRVAQRIETWGTARYRRFVARPARTRNAAGMMLTTSNASAGSAAAS